jgi:hypothetical protein
MELEMAMDMTSNQAATQQARVDLAAALRWIARLGMHEGVCNRFTVSSPAAGS